MGKEDIWKLFKGKKYYDNLIAIMVETYTEGLNTGSFSIFLMRTGRETTRIIYKSKKFLNAD